MTSAEQRYSQTEKDALAVKWAKTRFRIYLLGAPKFKIITSHKLVVIDKRTQFPVVEQTTSSSRWTTCDRLRKIFATHRIPEILESDNGP